MSNLDTLELSNFVNEAFTDFTNGDNKRAYEAALAKARSEFGRTYPTIIGGKHRQLAKKFTSTNPANPSEVVGTHFESTPVEVDEAIDAARAAFTSWKKQPVIARVKLLLEAAKIIRERHFDFCAWLTLEVGKNWAEADADVGECIDFLEFYAREALKLDGATTPIQFPGEKNLLRYLPLGVGAVIPPWNFPFAIMAGMTAASIVCGNTVVLKPSPDAPTMAALFVEVLEEVGVPAGVVNLVHGGPAVGRALTESPLIHFIAFTGSKKVGLEIHERAAKVIPGQRHIKRTILELGGKDAIIVEADADIDAAVDGVVASAFGFNGQKCSACSRAIVADAIYDSFCDRVKEKVEAIKSGTPESNAYAGPVINQLAYDRVLSYIEIGKAEGKLLTGGVALKPAEEGYFLAPTVFRDVPAKSRIAQEEVFGPFLAIIRSSNFNDALAIANDTEYGLTGAIYTSSREKLNRARDEFHVGNLYLNRKCTGAMVGAHPFGGFNLSGTDSKAGGPDYLTLFTQAKSVAEKRGVVSDAAEEEAQRMGI
ncbi:L-glutamate gamma-semialdehyde dehydrogenase [Granulicella cerasi]|uniref:L-glutamate gamma-semialdehyde dehydrogenase n=1 Tax=Granulicella cerasi TaxID=741063 RepID=A0ABW1Z6D1_9BACT